MMGEDGIYTSFCDSERLDRVDCCNGASLVNIARFRKGDTELLHESSMKIIVPVKILVKTRTIIQCSSTSLHSMLIGTS